MLALLPCVLGPRILVSSFQESESLARSPPHCLLIYTIYIYIYFFFYIRTDYTYIMRIRTLCIYIYYACKCTHTRMFVCVCACRVAMLSNYPEFLKHHRAEAAAVLGALVSALAF